MKESNTSEASFAATSTDLRLSTSFGDTSISQLYGSQANNKFSSGVVGSEVILSARNAMKNR